MDRQDAPSGRNWLREFEALRGIGACLVEGQSIDAACAELVRLREALQTIRLATCDYTVGTRASMAAAHKLATDALKTSNAEYPTVLIK